jgi:2-C-methyl-D-erythritol 4-phosphate cytidylyltransferase
MSERRPASKTVRCLSPHASSRCWAIILAGGSGERLGGKIPKAFVPLAGRPILAWSTLALAQHPVVTDVLAVVPRGWREKTRKQVLLPLGRELDGIDVTIHEPVVGGRKRQDSARAGLAAVLKQTPEDQLEATPILIHDAARPLVRADVIDQLLLRLREAHRRNPGVAGVIPVLGVEDTLKVVRGEVGAGGAATQARVLRTAPRVGLWRVQTPQAFCLGPIVEAHQEAIAANRRVTDDAMLYEWMGWPVETVMGNTLSLKVTYPADLELLEAYLTVTGQAVPEFGRDLPRPQRRRVPSKKARS